MGEIADDQEDIFLRECSELGVDPRHWLVHDPLLSGDNFRARMPRKKAAVEEPTLFDSAVTKHEGD